jgi:hypothetical protein
MTQDYLRSVKTKRPWEQTTESTVQHKERGKGQQPTEKRPAKHPLYDVTKRLQFQFPEAAVHALRDLAVRIEQTTIARVLHEVL